MSKDRGLNEYASSRSFEIFYENDIAGDNAAKTGELFAVARPFEIEYLIGREIGQLPGLTSLNRLTPYI